MVAQAVDRLSLAVSGLVAGGVVLMVLAMMMQEVARVPPADPPVAPPPVRAAAPGDMPRAIRLPPAPLPPAPAARPATTPALPPKPLPAPSRKPPPPPRVVEPLKVATPKPRVAPPVIAPLRPVAKAPRTTTAEMPTPPASPAIDSASNRKEGGALLRLLEHGKGPVIEIAWPRSSADQRTLYHRLTRCYGMRAAVLGPQSRLFDAGSPPGEPWDIDRDRISGFLRAPQGEEVAEESRAFAAIARRHGLTDWHPVRVFPRDVDAALLGGLSQLIGPRYRTARSITAAYGLGASRLTLERFRIDGAPIAGSIALAPHRAGCR